MTKTIEEVLAIQGGYKVDFLKEKMHDLCYTPIEAMRAMNEYAKQECISELESIISSAVGVNPEYILEIIRERIQELKTVNSI